MKFLDKGDKVTTTTLPIKIWVIRREIWSSYSCAKSTNVIDYTDVVSWPGPYFVMGKTKKSNST